MIFGDLHLDSSVFALAAKNLIPIHFLSNGQKFHASLIFDFSKNVFLRNQQLFYNQNQEKRLEIAKIFVASKIHNQNIFLQKIRVKERLKIDEIDTASIEELIGFEGFYARKYFSFWQSQEIIKNEEVKFLGRKKFPATDEINSLLSFCFTLLHNEIHTQLMIASLDPFVGFLHNQSYGHAALASDFLEIYRGLLEHFVVKSINRKEFDISQDFEKQESGIVKLSRSGFAKFFPKWSEFLRKEEIYGKLNLTQIIEKDVRKFVHFLFGDEDIFQPFLWRK